MKLELFNEETNNVWKKISPGKGANPLHFELEIHKKILNFFQVGDYFYFIFNLIDRQFDFVSPLVEPVLGYSPSMFTVLLFFDMLHPDDREFFLAFETKAAQFLSALPIEKLMKYKVRYDFRVKKADGTYIRVLHQVAVIQHNDDGGIIRTLGVHTDITHLKKDGKPIMSLIGMEGEPSFLDVNVQNHLTESKQLLSRREKEVLILLIEGKLSKEIGHELNISKQTVDTHLKNMFRKNGLSNRGELIGKAIRQGWV